MYKMHLIENKDDRDTQLFKSLMLLDNFTKVKVSSTLNVKRENMILQRKLQEK